MGGIREARLVEDRAVINLVAIADYTFQYLSHIHKNERDVLAPSSLERIQKSCQNESFRLLTRKQLRMS